MNGIYVENSAVEPGYDRTEVVGGDGGEVEFFGVVCGEEVEEVGGFGDEELSVDDKSSGWGADVEG